MSFLKIAQLELQIPRQIEVKDVFFISMFSNFLNTLNGHKNMEDIKFIIASK